MKDTFDRWLSNKTDEELWKYMGKIKSELKTRGSLRSGNVTGDRGELVAINYYNSTPNEPKLLQSEIGTKNFDATSRGGKRFSIKTVNIKTKSTGAFQADDFTEQRFDHLIVVRLDDLFGPVDILEAPWSVVNSIKRFHKTMGAYNVPLTKKNLAKFRKVYQK